MKDVKVLYIEDDLFTAENIIAFLEDEKFVVSHTDSIVNALALIKVNSFDIVLLDLKLQDYDGFEFLKGLKKNHIPVIVISALNETSIKVKAFRYGASDYMVKPIDLMELEARMWVVMGRHTTIPMEDEKDLFYIKDDNIYYHDKLLELTPIEYELMKFLIKNKNNTVSRESLVKNISTISSHRTLDYHIKNIRSKIQDDSKSPKYLKTIYGVGYKLVF